MIKCYLSEVPSGFYLKDAKIIEFIYTSLNDFYKN